MTSLRSLRLYDNPNYKNQIIDRKSRRQIFAEARAPASSIPEFLHDGVSLNPKSLWFKGVVVIKIDSKGKFQKRYVTISKDKMAIFCTQHPLDNDVSSTTTTDNHGSSGGFHFGAHIAMALGAKNMLHIRKGVQNVTGERYRYIDVADVVDVMHGFVGSQKLEKSRNEDRLKGKESEVDIKKEQIVTLIHHGYHTLNLLISDSTLRESFILTLMEMREAYKIARKFVDNEALLLRYCWYDVDLNKDNYISEQEFIHILQRINIHVKYPTRVFRKFIKEKFIDRERKTIRYNECMQLLQEIKISFSSGGDVSPSAAIADSVWDAVFGCYKHHITANEFLTKFLHKSQNETDATIEDVQLLFESINDIEVNRGEESYPEDCLSRFRFELFLKNEINDVYDPKKIESIDDEEEEVLDKPLSYYWINTSHNTYLLGDQLASSSSVEMYMRALRRGCKCLGTYFDTYILGTSLACRKPYILLLRVSQILFLSIYLFLHCVFIVKNWIVGTEKVLIKLMVYLFRLSIMVIQQQVK